MHRRWNLVVMFCLAGVLALGASAVSPAPPSSLAMQNETPTPPSEAASTFCPEPIPANDDSLFEPAEETVGVVPVPDLPNPNDTNADSAKLRLTLVTMPAGACMLGSYFYPGVIVTVLSGEIELLVEHWPGDAEAPVVSRRRAGMQATDIVTEMPASLFEGDWLKIENESFVGFKNTGNEPAEFVVAGLKPDGDPGGGGCGGNCRDRP